MYLLYQISVPHFKPKHPDVAAFATEEAALSAKELLASAPTNEFGAVFYNGMPISVEHLRVRYIPEWEDSKVGRTE